MAQQVARWRFLLPWALLISRGLLGPVVLWIGLRWHSGPLIVACIAVALVSDIFDGILARRWKTDGPRLRRCDSLADTFFYTCVLAVVLLNYPSIWQRDWPLLTGLVVLEVGQHLFAWIKFRHMASYHSILAKMWGLLLAGAIIALFGFGVNNWLQDAAIAWGIVCNLEGLAMSIMLPTWQRDVPTLGHALRLRRNLNSQRGPVIQAQRDKAPGKNSYRGLAQMNAD